MKYNVFGGGDSALYGVESSSFYMRNGLNTLNLILPLGLVYPVVALLDLFQVTGARMHASLLPTQKSPLASPYDKSYHAQLHACCDVSVHGAVRPGLHPSHVSIFGEHLCLWITSDNTKCTFTVYCAKEQRSIMCT